MATPYLGEIRVMTFGFTPKGWMACNGQLLAINSYQALFALLGTQYGGNGVQTFALPNLQGRVPVGVGGALGLVQGEFAGEENHTLVTAELPAHSHLVRASTSQASSSNPSGALPAIAATGDACYADGSGNTTLAAASVGAAGGTQPHANLQPFLTLNFCIAASGIFPSRG